MRFLILLLAVLVLTKCANQTSPGGGPQDKKPPEVLTSEPANNQRNVKSQTIELNFNEYIALKNANEEILISPSIGKDIKITAKKKRVTITPKQIWKENTTYSINFRDAIQDITENTPANNLRLAFSTGDTIDSLRIAGSVYEIFKDEVPEKITVALYSSDTFNIYKHQPTYFTKADKAGRFSIQNLKAGNYFLYAFDDRNKNLLVESKTEKFGYIVNGFVLPSKDSAQIPLIRVDTRPIKVTSFRSSAKISTLRLNKATSSIKVSPHNTNDFLFHYGTRQDEIIFQNLHKESSRDSIQLTIQLTDSLNVRRDTSVYLKFIPTKIPKEKFRVAYNSSKYDLENKTLVSKIKFNKPLAIINYDSIYIQLDSTSFQNTQVGNVTYDTLLNTLTLTTTLAPKGEPPLLIYGKGSFISHEQDSSQSKTETIKIPKETDLGSMAINVETKQPYFIIELLNRSKEIVSTICNTKKHTFKHLIPDEYKIRITIDKNGNKTWDSGNFLSKVEPERVIIYKTFDGKTTTPIRANWDVGPLTITF
jgi:uncharacterized protein (DUF2141 family)